MHNILTPNERVERIFFDYCSFHKNTKIREKGSRTTLSENPAAPAPYFRKPVITHSAGLLRCKVTLGYAVLRPPSHLRNLLVHESRIQRPCRQEN